eukprot:733209-Rhodomonas_salina.2
MSVDTGKAIRYVRPVQPLATTASCAAYQLVVRCGSTGPHARVVLCAAYKLIILSVSVIRYSSTGPYAQAVPCSAPDFDHIYSQPGSTIHHISTSPAAPYNTSVPAW